MAAALLAPGSRHPKRSFHRRAASLIELLVVLFIIGIMLSLLLPALSGARNHAQATVCQNNIRELTSALHSYIHTTKKFPVPNRWTVDVLRWTEEWPLAQAMKGNFDRNADFPRPPLLRCPMQEEFPSRVPSVGFCHYVLTNNRPIDIPANRINLKLVYWQIHDRQLLSQEVQEEPWYIGPELTYFARDALFANEPGPHPSGLYMTGSGLYPR